MELTNVNNKYLLNSLPEITKNHIGTEVADLKFIGGGSNGKVFKARLDDGRTIALKAFREQGSQEKEANQLRILSENTFVKMPDVLFTHSDKCTAVMGMTFIDGSNVLNPVFLLKSKLQKEKFAKDVIDGMSQWHKVTGKKFGNLENPEYNSWLEFYRTEKQIPWLKGLEHLCKKGKFSKKKLDLLLRATDVFNNLPDESEKPVLIHGDLNIMNIMADPKTFKLNGFIDPCGSMWADREYDLFQLLNMWGNCFGLYEKYKEVNGESQHTDFRVAYYGAMNEAACRLGSGLIMPLWEELCNSRLKKETQKY